MVLPSELRFQPMQQSFKHQRALRHPDPPPAVSSLTVGFTGGQYICWKNNVGKVWETVSKSWKLPERISSSCHIFQSSLQRCVYLTAAVTADDHVCNITCLSFHFLNFPSSNCCQCLHNNWTFKPDVWRGFVVVVCKWWCCQWLNFTLNAKKTGFTKQQGPKWGRDIDQDDKSHSWRCEHEHSTDPNKYHNIP